MVLRGFQKKENISNINNTTITYHLSMSRSQVDTQFNGGLKPREKVKLPKSSYESNTPFELITFHFVFFIGFLATLKKLPKTSSVRQCDPPLGLINQCSLKFKQSTEQRPLESQYYY